MKTFRALFFFDFSRCRFWVAAWWLYCLVQSLVCIFPVVSGENLFGLDDMLGFDGLAYLLLLVLIGLLFRPAHPGLGQSFFRARPVVPIHVLASRWCFTFVFLLLPHFVAQLAPLLRVDSSFEAVSAFGVYYWSVHLGGLALLSALAAGSQKISSYLLRAFFGGAALLAVAEVMSRFSWRESNWIYVASPEAGRLLWESGLCVLGLLIFVWITSALYRGRASWRLAALGVCAALVLASAWKPIIFRTDVSKVGHALPTELIDVTALSFDLSRSDAGGYEVQRNDSQGSHSTGGQSAPPYWNGGAEEFWFVRGSFEIEGLDPQLAYAARLVDARWVSPEGEVIAYDPPSGTHSIRNLGFSTPPPVVTTARINTLLGEPAVRAKYFVPNTGKTRVLLFGTWTSIYERFKTLPGRLELSVRVDFYRHDIGQRISLGGMEPSNAPGEPYDLLNVAYAGDELEIHVNKFLPAQRWGVPIEQRWMHASWNWLIYDPVSGQRGPSMGQSSSGNLLWQSLYERRYGVQFRPNSSHWGLPDLSQPESLELLYIQPHYLGSAVVDVTMEDFPLVTQETIERAGR